MAQIADVLAEILSSYGLTPARNRTTEVAGRTHTFNLVVKKKSQEIFVHVDDSGTPADARKLDAHWQAVRAAGGQHGIYISKAGFDEEGARAASGCGLVLWGPEELERVVGRAILRDALPLGRSVQDILSVTYHPPLADTAAASAPARGEPVASATPPAAAPPLAAPPPTAPAPPAPPTPKAGPAEPATPSPAAPEFPLLPTVSLEFFDTPEAPAAPEVAKPGTPPASPRTGPAPATPEVAPPAPFEAVAPAHSPAPAPALEEFFAAAAPAPAGSWRSVLPAPPAAAPAVAPPQDVGLPATPTVPFPTAPLPGPASPPAAAPEPASAPAPLPTVPLLVAPPTAPPPQAASAAGPLLWDLPAEGPTRAPDAPAATVTHFGLDVIPVGAPSPPSPRPADSFVQLAAEAREGGDPFTRLAARLERERSMERFAPVGPAPPATAWPDATLRSSLLDTASTPATPATPPHPVELLPPSVAGGPPAGLPASPPGPAQPAPVFDAASGTVIYAAPKPLRAPTAPHLGGARSDGRARPPIAAPASPRPLDDAALEWAPETGTILRPAVTRELATAIGRDRIFVVDSVSMRLIPRHVYEHSVDVMVDGKVGRHRVSGVKTVDATTGAVGGQRAWNEPATVPRLVTQDPIVAATVLLPDAKAREKAVDAVIEETAKAVTVEDVDNRSEFMMVTRRQVRIARSDVAIAPRGLHWYPVWALEGMNGSIEIDALTGEILGLVNRNRGTNVIEL